MRERIRISKSIWNQSSWDQILFLTRGFAYGLSYLTAWQGREDTEHPYTHLFPWEQVLLKTFILSVSKISHTWSTPFKKFSLHFPVSAEECPSSKLVCKQMNEIPTKEMLCSKSHSTPLCQAIGKISSRALRLYWNALVFPYRTATPWYVQCITNSQFCVHDFG